MADNMRDARLATIHAMRTRPPRPLPALRPALLAAALSTLAACGGSGGSASTGGSTEAARSDITLDAAQPGPTPFIAGLPMHGPGTDQVRHVDYTIARLPGATAAPVSVAVDRSWLERLGHAQAGGTSIDLPVAGLHDGQANAVHVVLTFDDGSTLARDVTITTAPWSDPDGIHDHPTVLVPRAPGAGGIEYFWLKNTEHSPIVIDADGRVRWVAPGVAGTYSSDFTGGAFLVADAKGLDVQRLEMDGTVSGVSTLAFAGGIDFSHDLQPGATGGELGEVDADVGGITVLRSIALRFDPATGAVSQSWNLGDVIASWMRAHGDDPTPFVRPGTDWFHMNAVIDDPVTHHVVVSSRENFILEFDPATDAIDWILGDPTKYWATFPSLRARALSITGASSLVPIGQHDINFTSDGLLLFFNDGANSFNQPVGAPAGAKRAYSAISAYAIDTTARTATEAWHIDDGQAVFSRLCGSARQMPDGSVLSAWPDTDAGAHARVIGFDAAHHVAFDFQYASPGGCAPGWNAQPFAFDHLVLQ